MGGRGGEAFLLSAIKLPKTKLVMKPNILCFLESPGNHVLAVLLLLLPNHAPVPEPPSP